MMIRMELSVHSWMRLRRIFSICRLGLELKLYRQESTALGWLR